MKVTIDITHAEINALEHLAVCWNLCRKHNKMTFPSKTSEEIFKWTETCPACKRINKRLSGLVLGVWNKVLTAMEKSEKMRSMQFRNKVVS